jgi:hypothetical protein
MSRRTVAAIAAVAMASMLIGCSSTAGPAGSSSQQQQASATSQQPQASSAAQQQQASATSQQQQASSVQACSVLTNAQVGSEFGATFAAGKQTTVLNFLNNALSSTQCDFESKDVTVSIIVVDYPTDTDAKGAMSDDRARAIYNAGGLGSVTEMPGVGDDAVIAKFVLSLSKTQENLWVRKGSVIYLFQDNIVTGTGDGTVERTADVAAARSHLVNLAHLVVG